MVQETINYSLAKKSVCHLVILGLATSTEMLCLYLCKLLLFVKLNRLKTIIVMISRGRVSNNESLALVIIYLSLLLVVYFFLLVMVTQIHHLLLTTIHVMKIKHKIVYFQKIKKIFAAYTFKKQLFISSLDWLLISSKTFYKS